MNKKLRIKLGTFLLAATMCVPTVSVFASTEVHAASVSNEIITRAPAYEWVFKVVNGKLYKRLFNIKSGEYIGEWIPA